MDNIRFMQGERRYVEFEIIPCRANDTLVVTEAIWSLQQNGTVADSGACEVNGRTIRALLAPVGQGVYQLELTVTVPPETRKERLMLYVD